MTANRRYRARPMGHVLENVRLVASKELALATLAKSHSFVVNGPGSRQEAAGCGMAQIRWGFSGKLSDATQQPFFGLLACDGARSVWQDREGCGKSATLYLSGRNSLPVRQGAENRVVAGFFGG